MDIKKRWVDWLVERYQWLFTENLDYERLAAANLDKQNQNIHKEKEKEKSNDKSSLIVDRKYLTTIEDTPLTKYSFCYVPFLF